MDDDPAHEVRLRPGDQFLGWRVRVENVGDKPATLKITHRRKRRSGRPGFDRDAENGVDSGAEN